MRETVILDTGPLVAWLSKSDQHHDWAVEQFGRLPPRVLTCDGDFRHYRRFGRSVIPLLAPWD